MSTTKFMQTASQTVGPYFAIGMIYGEQNNLITSKDVPGKRLSLTGRVLDGRGEPIDDAAIEIWQARADGTFATDGTFGFGRCATDDSGEYRFLTVKPGRVAGQAPHISVRVFMRGLLLHTVTRVYFEDEDNSTDAVLNAVPSSRKESLIAQRVTPSTDAHEIYRWDICMQGDRETVFFEP